MAVGSTWWALAPAAHDATAWILHDLTLAGLFVLAGGLFGVVLAGRTTRFSQLKFAILLTGGLLGAVLAWGAGMGAAAWWGGPLAAQDDAGTAFSLRSPSVLLVWPAATATAAFVTSLVSLVGRPPTADQGTQQRAGHDDGNMSAGRVK